MKTIKPTRPNKPAGRLAYNLDAAAEQVSVSPDTLRRCIKNNHPTLPPLPAKRGQRGQYLIRHTDLETWLDHLEAA